MVTFETASRHRTVTPVHRHAAPPGAADGTRAARVQVREALQTPRIQPKLTVGAPDDEFEREADRVAEQVMLMRDLSAVSVAAAPPRIQRMCTECAEEEGVVQRTCAECAEGEGAGHPKCAECKDEEKVRASAEPGGPHPVPHGSEPRFAALRGGGQPLAAPERAFFEPRFGRDFGGVRVHTGPAAHDLARSVRARAFTLGDSIVVAAGQPSPATTAGRRLLAHELTHVLQQREAADRAAVISRTPLDVTQIKADIDAGARTHTDLFSWVQVMGDRSGEIGHGAAAPTQATAPDPAPVPTDPALPINGRFFPSFVRHHDRRALVVGGFHGKEHPGFELADALLSDLQSGTGPELAFHTLVVPRLNPGGIADDSRCNRQLVDLNRNFRLPGITPAAVSECANTVRAPIQPETQALINTIHAFQPQRIVSLHAISSAAQAGIFADPSTDAAARQLACSMAARIVDPANRRGNRLTTTRCNPVYGGGATGGTSLGAFAPTRAIPGQTVPVITLEVPEFPSFTAAGSTRTAADFLPALRGFLQDPATLLHHADALLLREIETLSQPQRRLFLTGRVPAADALLGRIRDRILEQVSVLNGLRPSSLPTITIHSDHRGFERSIGRATGQAHIIFGKFTLTGAFTNGWDTLPDRYFVGGNRSSGVARAAWLAEPSATRLDIILRFSAVPGASRHHWGTDVDFNSVANADWAPPSAGSRTGRTLYALGQWLQSNAARAGFVQSYTAGRPGGHAEEPWHWSYAPIALRLREMYGREVQMPPDVVDPTMDFFTRQAARERITLPADLRSALTNLDIAQYVNTIGPGL